MPKAFEIFFFFVCAAVTTRACWSFTQTFIRPCEIWRSLALSCPKLWVDGLWCVEPHWPEINNRCCRQTSALHWPWAVLSKLCIWYLVRTTSMFTFRIRRGNSCRIKVVGSLDSRFYMPKSLSGVSLMKKASRTSTTKVTTLLNGLKKMRKFSLKPKKMQRKSTMLMISVTMTPKNLTQFMPPMWTQSKRCSSWNRAEVSILSSLCLTTSFLEPQHSAQNSSWYSLGPLRIKSST